MRRLLLVVSLSAGLATGALAQNAEIEANIRAQMRALQADDFVTAFTYASPGIQTLFRTPENFGAMVRNGYPMVWRPADVRFLDLRQIDGQWWQKVMVVDGDGQAHILDYQMEQRENGWKINGVLLLGNADPAA